MKITKGEKSFTPSEAVRYKLQTVSVKTIITKEDVIEQKINNLGNMMARLVETGAFLRERGEKIAFLQVVLGNDFTIKED
jgi:hypothetical protein